MQISLIMKICTLKSILVVTVVFSLSVLTILGSETSPVHPEESRNSETAKDLPVQESENSIPVRQVYKDFEKKLKSAISSAIKRSMPVVMREVYSRNLSSLCLTGLLQVTAALRQTKLWAFQMLDSSGKLPSGFLAGTLTTLGNYEECVGIDVNHRSVKMKGQYCFIEITPPLPKWRPYMSLHHAVPELKNFSSPDTLSRFLSNFIHNFYVVAIKSGLCVPSTCSKDDINKLVGILPEKLGLDWKFAVDRCETRTTFQFSSLQMYIVYLFIMIVVLILIATAADLILEQEFMERKGVKGMMFQLLRCFSLRLTMLTISKYTCPSDNLRFVYGFMYVSTIWTIGSNMFINVNYDIAANFMGAVRMTTNIFYQILTSRIHPYQTLFFLGAFVTSYKWMKSPEQNPSIWKYILRAYWRYTPSYMLLIALCMLTPGWGSGPSWTNHMNPVYENCRINWWTNILYINNYLYTDKMCLQHSWFLSVAAQLHIIGIVVLVPLKRRPKIGLFVNFFLAVGSLFAIFFLNLYNEALPNEIISFLHNADRLHYAKQTYFNPYYHLTVYCSGIFAGYLVATRPTINISPKLSYFFWFLSALLTFTVVCLVNLWSDGMVPKPIYCASYDVFSRVVWASFLLWAAVSLSIEQKGICFDVMSWAAFPFLSRLIFPIILLNAPVIRMVFGIKKSHIFVSHFEIFYNLGGLLVCNVIAAYTFHVAVESPILQLTKVLSRACGYKTFNSSSATISNECEGVTTEKQQKRTIQNGTSEKKIMEKKAG